MNRTDLELVAPSPDDALDSSWSFAELASWLADDSRPTRAERRARHAAPARPDHGTLPSQFGARNPLPRHLTVAAIDRNAARGRGTSSTEVPEDFDDYQWSVLGMGEAARLFAEDRTRRALHHAATAELTTPDDPAATVQLEDDEHAPLEREPLEPPPMRTLRLVLTRAVLSAAPPLASRRRGSAATVLRAA
ncbi:hypothetical protein IGS67_13500 [Flavimobilis sp. GY10621]|uniref:Uncharacterized protein n=1 Tax=Flavimobilis rhizosphaerae TaxID=2775421 RepID=A0ABR9DTM9_9MICO|nr:hypothetical protein [Flavimobilis rhizosphaerae]MBD9700485.1 hypothetical protein [Flavimobilis rhizosphaerae]